MEAEVAWFQCGVTIYDGSEERVFAFMGDTLYEPNTKIAWKANRSGNLILKHHIAVRNSYLK